MRQLVLLLLTCLIAGCTSQLGIDRSQAAPVTVGIIAFNDFHGHLESDISEAPKGGAAWLAGTIAELRGKYRYHATVSAGDLISASPIVSSLFLDEPTIGAMNRIGLDFNAVGNHEFDRGRAELLRMQEGGCEKFTLREACRLERFTGARFGFLAASTFTEDATTLFPATAIKRFGEGPQQVAVGFIGLTLAGTPTLVSPDGIAGLTYGDEANAINAAVPRLKAEGANAIVVLIHQGGETALPDNPNRCDGLDGAIVPILSRMDQRVDVVVSGHTHRAYVCDFARIDPSRPALLTSAGSYGRLVTEIVLTIDPDQGKVVAARATNHAVNHGDFAPDADVAAYVRRYADAVREIAARPVGKLSGAAARTDRGWGGPLGNLIADAQLAATAAAGAQIALTNPFGIRDALDPARDGTVTFGRLYAVQPFGNLLHTRAMSGAELKSALEQGLDDEGPKQPLAPSSGFVYSFDPARPAGERIIAMALDGEPIRTTSTYRVTTNAFLANGGDGFSAFTGQRDSVLGAIDLDALTAWISAVTERAVPTEQRVIEVAP